MKPLIITICFLTKIALASSCEEISGTYVTESTDCKKEEQIEIIYNSTENKMSLIINNNVEKINEYILDGNVHGDGMGYYAYSAACDNKSFTVNGQAISALVPFKFMYEKTGDGLYYKYKVGLFPQSYNCKYKKLH